MEKYYSFAGVSVTVRCPGSLIYTDERRLAPFAQAAPSPDAHTYTFALADALPAPAGPLLYADPAFRVYAAAPVAPGEPAPHTDRYVGSVGQSVDSAYMLVQNRGREHTVLLRRSSYPGRIGTNTVLNALQAEHLVLEQGGVVLHSSYVEWQGRAILFTAPSGTGKSTQAALWEQHRGAALVNGDRSVLRRAPDGASPTGFAACGLPFSGSSQTCRNVTRPLAAIVYLGQAPQTTIRRLRGAEAFRRVWEGCSVNTWSRADLDAATALVLDAVTGVPVYRLDCTPDESAVAALYNCLKEAEPWP